MSSSTVGQQLINAVDASNLVNLRALLSQENDDGRVAATDEDINRALWKAAELGQVESSRVICERLSASVKEKYAAAESFRFPSPLIAAVMFGHPEVVRLFKEYDFFNINQNNGHLYTPLCNATHSPEMSRFLLDSGADSNQGGFSGGVPLHFAVVENSTEVVRLLLQHGADPNLNCRRRADEEDEDDHHQDFPRNTDNAIENGNPEILSMLLQHGAVVKTSYPNDPETSLNLLLNSRNEETSRETKLSICRMLISHAINTDRTRNTKLFLKRSFQNAIKEADNEACEVLLEAGMDPEGARALHCAIQAENLFVCRLLVRHGADPFPQEENGRATPFHAAARLKNPIILEYFLGLWDERFSSNGGVNSDGDFPIHVLCCDSRVTLQAIQLVVKRQATTVAMTDGEQGLLPFHFAAMWDARLDVIFHLLQHYPNALGAKDSTTTENPPLSSGKTNDSNAAETTSYDGKRDGPSRVDVCRRVKKKAKTTH